jgi:creatinine amidohydrolase
MTEKSSNHVGLLAWDQVRRRLDDGAAAKLPIGAGAKEHGLHLPMDTDQRQAEWLAQEVANRIDALIWPTVTYGYYPAFVEYAGSCSLSAETFKAVLRELIGALLGFGPRAVLVLDTGISTLAPVAEAVEGFGSHPVHHLKVYVGPRYAAQVAELSEQAYGSHADELETSRMLTLAPEAVQMDRAQASPANASFDFSKGPMSPTDPSSANYSPSGTFGDPTLADAEKGDALSQAMLEDVLEMAEAVISEGQADAKKPPEPIG